VGIEPTAIGLGCDLYRTDIKQDFIDRVRETS
jgi:hypothetical protein